MVYRIGKIELHRIEVIRDDQQEELMDGIPLSLISLVRDLPFKITDFLGGNRNFIFHSLVDEDDAYSNQTFICWKNRSPSDQYVLWFAQQILTDWFENGNQHYLWWYVARRHEEFQTSMDIVCQTENY